ncbi:family 2 glycosyl transferase [Herbaspirillum rubrisubalbicans]|uniref:Family 2 glycosyl transferase n=1 Tax=Herbaspirillum rubrisubalbicans TaxID=80842 RepID=A0ABX9BV29_9BURK|nr:glycosyltransferase family A protein [Herbaspirillum rubrisubalbicans]RAM61654.1 family 2 glycosyl transferase [Herbaspirillum rubrisubalbicans]RAN44038.1 family 2 glycosyl transferase [Herbaspirillum rubrisubalbicans]
MKVSICIPAYRQVEYLRETLKSVLTQDFQDFEVIVTDDSPDDSVRNLLTEFDFGNRLRYVHNTPALGSPENWNAALRLAQGEYVKIMHHDDYFIRTDALRLFVQMLDEQPDVDFAFCATLVNHIDVGMQRVHCATERQLASLAEDPASLFVGNCIGAPSATICRRSASLDYDRQMKWLVDIDYYYRMLMNNRYFAYTTEALITTPTNAGHQVTEICRDDGKIELGEAMCFFRKFSPQQRNNPLVRQGWLILFKRFKVRKLSDFARYDVEVPQEPEVQNDYFTALLRKRYTNWSLLRDPKLLALKIFYRLYPFVPGFIRRPLKCLHARLGLAKHGSR